MIGIFAIIPVIFFAFLVEFSTFADVSLGVAMNNSSMNISPIVTNSDNEYTFRKNSISLYGQKSLLKQTLSFTGKTEIVNISRDPLTVNGTEIAGQKNQGIRSLELSAMQYLYTSRGWRYHGQFGYNIKGSQGGSELQFALPNDEYGASFVAIRAKKPRGVITPILNGIMGIVDVPIKKIEIGTFFGKNYNYVEGSALIIQPISKKISLKAFGKLRRYNLQNNATAFIDEEKIMGGIIFKNRQHNSLEFNFYHDFVSNEFGSSIGINYFIGRKHSDIETKMLNYYEKKYVKRQKSTKTSDDKKKELELMVDSILEDKGF